jgi:biotin-(acetyl-CoA carboxylase) ligase
MPYRIQRRADMRMEPPLALPPPYTLTTLREVGDAFAHAIEVAPREGAGTLVYVGRFDLAEFAVVLEPEEPLRTARRAFYACMAALADSLISFAPPEKLVTIEWPGTCQVDGGRVGGGRLGWPEGADEAERPPWMVFGAMIRTVSMDDNQGGLFPMESALADEGFSDFSSGQLVESFARHLMVYIDAWQEKGFSAVESEYLQRLPREKGILRRIDQEGNLTIRRAGKVNVESRELLSALQAPSWFDPNTRGPRT